jgi:hypothetical protein
MPKPAAKRIDAVFADQIHGWYGHTGGDGHLFDHVEQLALLRVTGILMDQHAAKGFCDCFATSLQGQKFEATGNSDQTNDP